MNDDNTAPESRFVRNFHRSWSWLAALAGVAVTVLPDLANYILANTGVISTAFPQIDAETKSVILTVASVAVILLRPLRQRNMPAETIPVAVVKVPSTVSVGHGGPEVATEVEKHERQRADPGPGG